ncbi:MAG: two-component sensor histidine kinase [Gammaproteobacteria bacterium]|nr:MAG: two-component sensor histidine kinase [Gammaproteobacteria bacterium]
MNEIEAQRSDSPDRLFKVYGFYRVILSCALLAMFLMGVADNTLGKEIPNLFLLTAIGYVFFCALSIIPLVIKTSSPQTHQMFAMLMTDIVAITLIMHSSGGMSSGIAFLMLPTIAAGSILVTGQLPLLLAAIASISVMVETFSASALQGMNSEGMLPAGILGLLLFATTSVFQVLTQRIRVAQSLAIQKELETKQLQKLNESIIKRMRTGILVVDNRDNIKLINSAAVQLLGGHSPGLPLAVGAPLQRILSLKQQLERWRNYPWLRTPTFRTNKSGPELQANFTSLAQSQESQTLIFLEDTRALAQQAQQLKLASLGRLTASIAHEIRNPLGAISHASQLLGEQLNDTPSEKLIGIVLRHCARVNQIIENVLQLSRQKMPEFQKLWLRQWLKKFRSDYIDTQSQECTIEVELKSKDTQIFFDPSHLAQVLTNLVENAIRYSEQHSGERWVKFVVSRDSDSELPYLDVFDKGAGVPRNEEDLIFEPFFTTSHDGSGLGLYLSRELCEANYASLNYFNGETPENRYFRIGFSHPERLLPRPA